MQNFLRVVAGTVRQLEVKEQYSQRLRSRYDAVSDWSQFRLCSMQGKEGLIFLDLD